MPRDGECALHGATDRRRHRAHPGRAGAISALDRETGEPRWQTEANGFTIGPFGVAVADGRVIGLRGSTGVVALHAVTGEEIWARDITATPTAGIDIQPVVFDRKVFVSTVPISIGGIYAGGDRGIIHALGAATGATVWQFDTVESPDLWGNPAVNPGADSAGRQGVGATGSPLSSTPPPSPTTAPRPSPGQPGRHDRRRLPGAPSTQPTT